VTSRAFASLPDFTSLTRHLLAPGGVWMAMKGKLPADELSALPADVEVFHVEQLLVPGLDAQRCLVWMRPATAAH
jgi:16S rRNA (guanine527-N7)-methyltransferase